MAQNPISLTVKPEPLSPAVATTPKGQAISEAPELLAPAGNWECARAAVENGADAIYFGMGRFNARMRADNFSTAELPALMSWLHKRGVRGYVTFNTLIFQNELQAAEEELRAIIAAGVDAAIVQDVGICRLIRSISPDFPIHASTQMTVTSAAGMTFARDLGCNLAVLARECSIQDIESIRQAQENSVDGSASAPLPLEVFVHGALCVAYSGQCLTSESLGGRSANRGECAQACRMPYELLCDGKPVPLGDRRYLLSPQDLAGLEVLPDLIRSGVSSLKIEGRLKSPEYVANITRVYRNAIDRTMAALSEGAAPASSAGSGSDRYEVEMAFSRGLHTGWFRGINNQELVHARFGKKRGVFLGKISAIVRNGVQLTLEAPLKPGDGVVFDSGRPDEKEEGGRVYAVRTSGRAVVVEFGRDDIDFSRIKTGDRLWKTDDPELNRRLRQSFAGELPRFQRPLHIKVFGKAGEPMRLAIDDSTMKVSMELVSSIPLAPAEKHPLDTARLREQLGRLGNTPFKLGELDNQLEGDLILPVSELNNLRRGFVAKLEEKRVEAVRWSMNPVGSAVSVAAADKPAGKAVEGEIELVVLVRNVEQLQAVIRAGVKTIYCEFEDPKRYKATVQSFRSSAVGQSGGCIFLAPPRIFKPGEEWILKQVLDGGADGYLVRNYDHLEKFQGHRRRGDFSLNVANALTAEYFLRQFGLESVTASYDLNVEQLEALISASPSPWFEITIHQHMPMFHMEHCVFCAFLSKGTDFRNCGRPCDKHEVRLKDRVGAAHPLKADAGCRNTVFNSMAQTGAEGMSRLVAAGARRFRIEFLDENEATVLRTLEIYRGLIRGERTGAQVWRELRVINQLGVTRGQLEKQG